MTTPSRQSGVWGTGSRTDAFSRARVRLTVFYILVLMVVVSLLSVAVYALAVGARREPAHARLELLEIPRRAELHEDPLDDYAQDVLRALLLGDVLALAAAAALGYLLAGSTLRPIRDAVAAQERFFAQAAHDLRTPLAVMRTEAEVALARRDLSADEAGGVMRSQVEEISRLSLLVDGLLQISRPSPLGRPGGEALPVARLVESVVERLSGLAQRGGVRLVLAAAATGTVRGERADLERAISNVVDNAIKYTPAGGAVEVKVARVGHRVQVVISDTGIGIGEEDLPRVGEPFFRTDAAAAVHEAGTGLGLAIVDRIVRGHRGALRVASRSGVGTSVTLEFPAARP